MDRKIFKKIAKILLLLSTMGIISIHVREIPQIEDWVKVNTFIEEGLPYFELMHFYNHVVIVLVIVALVCCYLFDRHKRCLRSNGLHFASVIKAYYLFLGASVCISLLSVPAFVNMGFVAKKAIIICAFSNVYISYVLLFLLCWICRSVPKIKNEMRTTSGRLNFRGVWTIVLLSAFVPAFSYSLVFVHKAFEGDMLYMAYVALIALAALTHRPIVKYLCK